VTKFDEKFAYLWVKCSKFQFSLTKIYPTFFTASYVSALLKFDKVKLPCWSEFDNHIVSL